MARKSNSKNRDYRVLIVVRSFIRDCDLALERQRTTNASIIDHFQEFYNHVLIKH